MAGGGFGGIDFSNIDPVSGKYIVPPQGTRSLGVRARNPEIDQAELARQVQNDAAAQSGQPQTPPPAPALPPPGAPQAAPGAPPMGIAQPQGVGAPVGPQLLPYGGPPGGSAPHAVGLSPVDHAMVSQLKQSAEEQTGAIREGIAQHQDAVKAFADQSDSLALDSKLAASVFTHSQEENAQKRAALEAETREKQGRIETQLGELESRGINPNHYWETKSTPMKIGAAIAIGLGAFAAHGLGPNGHPTENTALSIINGAIEHDIDAQKTNLQKGLEVAAKKLQLNESGFNHRAALLTAERDSIQTSYQVAINDIGKRAALYGQNAEVAQKSQQLIDGLKASAAERIGKVNEQIYGIMKGGERQVGGASAQDPRIQAVRARAIAIRDKAAENGTDIPPAEAQRQAMAEVMGVDTAPGSPMQGYAKPQKGAGAGLSPKLRARVAELNASEQSVKELNDLLANGSSLSPSDRARAAVAANQLRESGFHSIPEQPLELISSPGARQAALGSALKEIRIKKKTLLEGGGAETEAASGEDLGGEKDE